MKLVRVLLSLAALAGVAGDLEEVDLSMKDKAIKE